MEWAYYWCNVVQRYQVIIDGWPADIPFKNLSGLGSIVALESLTRKWKVGNIHWKHLTDDEFTALDAARNADIENGTIVPPFRRRSSHGTKRQCAAGGSKDGPPAKKVKHISPETVNSDLDDETTNEEGGT